MKMTTKEVSDILQRPHHEIFKKVSCLLVEHPEHQKSGEFVLTEFVNSNKTRQKYPCYEMTEKGCKVLYEWLRHYNRYRTISQKMKELKKEMHTRFHPAEIPSWVNIGNILLSDRSRSEYQELVKLYNNFAEMTATKGRDLPEMEQVCDRFYRIIKSRFPSVKDNNEIMKAMWDIMGAAEMQGFIYGILLSNLMTSNKGLVA